MLTWLLSGPRRWYVPLCLLALSPLFMRRCTSLSGSPAATLGGPAALLAHEEASTCRQRCAAANESCFAGCEPSAWQACEHTCLATALACDETCARATSLAAADAPFFRYTLGSAPRWWVVLDAFEARGGGPDQCKVGATDRFALRFERTASQRVNVWVSSGKSDRRDQEICLENALARETFSDHPGAFVIVASWQPRHTAWGALYSDALVGGERSPDPRARRAAQDAAEAYQLRVERQEVARREALTRAVELIEAEGADREDERGQRDGIELRDRHDPYGGAVEPGVPRVERRSPDEWDPRGLMDEFGRPRSGADEPEFLRAQPRPTW